MPKVKVANTKEIQEGRSKLVTTNGKEIVLFKVNNQFFAMDNTCLHVGGSLAEGEIENNQVTCPLHGWQYDIKSGQNTMPGMGKLNSYKVEVQGEEIFIEV